MSVNGKTSKLRIVCVSDTHNQTPSLPAGDILIHAGDLTNQGTKAELRKQLDWLQSRKGFVAKILVAGNHDVTLDKEFYSTHGVRMHNQNPQDVDEIQDMVTKADSVTYLCHESKSLEVPVGDHKVTLNIFGSPWSLANGTWAFGYQPSEAEALWSEVPLDTDILITHGPPQGICDITKEGQSDGCTDLLKTLQRVRPRLHVCGHRHEGRGAYSIAWSENDGQVERLCRWNDPGVASRQKLSLVDLTGKKGQDSWIREDVTSINKLLEMELSRENSTGNSTCVVNAAIMAKSFSRGTQKVMNKPIVVDIEFQKD
ncbi:Metallo-dependent phosphatase [Microthyrium microscopicum]|uniref:Metallo-dependent phosphatase n=1 Tax=Microthyrium microscopicum TaxID=703497 RepID=A0A6A6TVT5_9PEZI|nr:Metallo-dependent phosphatase [Microthyrium microscopicum]